MVSVPIYCPQCSALFLVSETWPKRCSICPYQEWGNPKAVAVAVCGFDRSVLLQRRNIPPARGRLALIGGYVNAEETPEQTVARELREETERCDPNTGEVILPGLQLEPGAFESYANIGLPEENLILLAYVARDSATMDAIADWWRQTQPHIDRQEPGTIWNSEVQALSRVTMKEFDSTDIAFPSHQSLVLRRLREWEAEYVRP